MKKALYIFGFIMAFIITFLLTFPASSFAGYFLTENKINYEKIEGNIFELKIYGIKSGNLKIPNLTIKNRFIYIYGNLDKNNFIRLNLWRKTGIIKIKDLKLERFQVNPTIKGKLSTYKNFYLTNNYVIFEGKGKAFVSEIKPYGIKNINVRWEAVPEKEKIKITAFVTGRNINGEFRGHLILHLLKDIKLKGKFTGEFFGNQLSQNINLKFSR